MTISMHQKYIPWHYSTVIFLKLFGIKFSIYDNDGMKITNRTLGETSKNSHSQFHISSTQSTKGYGMMGSSHIT